MATVYLSTTGNDANTYAQAQNPATPWATPGKVQASAVTGDTVQMAAGTYTFVSITFTKAFTWNGASLSNGVPTTILDGGGVAVLWRITGTTSFSQITFQNVIQSGTGAQPMIAPTLFAVNAISISNCLFQNIQLAGTFIHGLLGDSGGSTNVTWTLTNSAFRDLYRASGVTANLGVIGDYNDIAPTWTVTNCTFYYARSDAQRMTYFYAGSGVIALLTVKNCIIYNGTGGTITFQTGVPAPVCTYSDNYLITGVPAGAGNITSDPLFVDVANGDFILRPTSPCLGTGTLA